MSYLPAKETWVKTISTVATGAGALVSAVGALTKGKASSTLGNAGAVANLLGTLLDDVPQSWLEERTDKKFTKLLGVAQPALTRLQIINPAFLVGYSSADAEDINNVRDVTKCARAIHFSKTQAARLEVREVEFVSATCKAVVAAIAFGISALDGGVGGFGGGGILAGALLGSFISEVYAPRPKNDQTTAPDAAALQAYRYTDLSTQPTERHLSLRQAERGTAGDYKGRIAIMKFCVSGLAAAGCLLGLSITQKRSDFGSYMDTRFVTAITNAIAAGAAIGSAIATYEGGHLKKQLNKHMDNLKQIINLNAPIDLEMQPLAAALRIRVEAENRFG